MERFYIWVSTFYLNLLHYNGIVSTQEIGQHLYGSGTKFSACGMCEALSDDIIQLEENLKTLKADCPKEFHRFSQNILESDVIQKDAKYVLKTFHESLRRQRYLKDLTSRIRENCAQFTTVAPCSGIQYAGHCYTLSSTKRIWTIARDDCQSIGGHLVDITSSAENNIVKELALMSPSDTVWLGATDELEEGVYRWVSNNQTMTFTDWYPNDPDGGRGQNCLSTYLESRLWIDNSCC